MSVLRLILLGVEVLCINKYLKKYCLEYHSVGFKLSPSANMASSLGKVWIVISSLSFFAITLIQLTRTN